MRCTATLRLGSRCNLRLQQFVRSKWMPTVAGGKNTSPRLGEALTHFKLRPTRAKSFELGSNVRQFGRRIKCALIGAHATDYAADRLLHYACLGAKCGIARLAKPIMPANISRPFGAQGIVSAQRKLSLLGRALAPFPRAPRLLAHLNDVKGPSCTTCRQLPEYATLDAQCALHDEVLEVVR